MVSTILAAALLLALPQAEAGAETESAAPPAPTLLAFRCSGLDAFLVDPRDAGLRRCLSMLDDRLLELPAELGQRDFPTPLATMVRDLLAAPLDLEVRLREPGGMAAVPVEVQLTSYGDGEHVESLGAGVRLVLGMADLPAEPVEGAPERSAARLPQGTLEHGPLPAGAGRTGYVVAFGQPRTTPLEIADPGLPDGVEPATSCLFDLAPVQPYLEFALASAGAHADQLYTVLEATGLLSDDPLVVRCAMGFGPERMHWVTRTENWVPVAEASGMLAAEPLTEAELRLLPADATRAGITKATLDFLVDLLDAVDTGGSALAQVNEAVGLDLVADVVEPLGTTWGWYTSEGTGGGGILSAVLFAKLDDPARIEHTIETLGARLGAWAQAEADGRVALRGWRRGERRCLSLRFPGLPVPLEPTLAVADGWLWMAASPQALVGALERADRGALVDRPAFSGLADGALEGLLSLSFQDTPALLSEGYTGATLLAAALANAARSPADPGREPGLVLPPLGELVEGSVPAITLGRIEGDDLVQRGSGDRSVVANVTAGLTSPVFLWAALSGALGAAGSAPMHFQETRGMHVEPVLRAAEPMDEGG